MKVYYALMCLAFLVARWAGALTLAEFMLAMIFLLLSEFVWAWMKSGDR